MNCISYSREYFVDMGKQHIYKEASPTKKEIIFKYEKTSRLAGFLIKY